MENTTSRRNVSAVTDIRIGHIIKAEREKKRLTLATLATAIDCNHSTVKNYESGRRTLTKGKIDLLSQILGIDARLIDPDAA